MAHLVRWDAAGYRLFLLIGDARRAQNVLVSRCFLLSTPLSK